MDVNSMFRYSENDMFVYVCGCGHVQKSENTLHSCEKCGCKKITTNNSKEELKFETISSLGYLESKRYIVKYTLDKDTNTITKKRRGEYSLVLNFKNEEYYCINAKKDRVEASEGRIRYFLKSIYIERDFINSIQDKNMRNLICIIRSLGTSLARGMKRYINYSDFKYIEVLCNANIPLNVIKGTLTSSWGYGGSRHTVINNKETNPKATKPHEILKINKTILKEIVKSDIDTTDIVSILRDVDVNLFVNLTNVLKLYGDEKIGEVSNGIKNIERLATEFNYKVSDLIRYAARDVKLSQGIMSINETVGLLLDLNKMCKDMEVKPNEKYPKSLKRDHDIASMNYKAQESEINKKRFKEVIEKEEYKKWSYGNKRYVVTMPSEPADLVKEGKGLHHCVASYINDVINEKCKIYFIREKENIKESLLTVEVRGEEIVQVKGFGNRPPSEEEKIFIEEWKNNKKLKKVI